MSSFNNTIGFSGVHNEASGFGASLRDTEQGALSSPRVLTGGEEKPRLAKVDWLNLSWLLKTEARLLSQKFMAEQVCIWLNIWLNTQVNYEYGAGLHGFTDSVRFYGLKAGEVQLLAICAWGGVNQKNRAYLELTGTACQVVKSWHLVYGTINKLDDVKITRLDLCVDFFNGEYTPMAARDAFGDGKFQFSRRMAPKTREQGDWTYHVGDGRTFYVGRKENGKEACIYEKGKQLGGRSDPWTRFEVRHFSRDRVIPLDAMLNPTEYFAGSYPVCQELVGMPGISLHTFQEEFSITVERLMEYAKLSYGKLINVMRLRGVADVQIIQSLLKDGVPKRLAKSDWQISAGSSDGPISSGA